MNKFASGFALRLGVIIILSVCLALLAFTSYPDFNDCNGIANAASEYPSAGTMLRSGEGPQFGPNSLRLTENDDFYIANGSATWDNDRPSIRLDSTDAKIASKIKLSPLPDVTIADGYHSELPEESAVAFAILDEDVFVTATIRLRIARCDTLTSNVKGKISIAYVTAAGADKPLPSTESTFTVNASSSDSVDASASIEISERCYDEGDSNATNSFPVGIDAHFMVYVEITEMAGEDVEKLEISLASLDVSCECVPLNINYDAGIGLTITGQNRTPVYIPDIKENGGAALADLYVKQGDKITITLSLVDTQNELKSFGYAYPTIFGRKGDSCIDWHTFVGSNYSNKLTYLTRIKTDEEVTGNYYMPTGTNNDTERMALQEFYGYTVSFRVASNVQDGSTLALSPRIFNGINEMGGYTYQHDPSLSDYYISIKVDNGKPQAPVIKTTSPLGDAIASNSWYTANKEVKLTYQGNTAATNRASEVVYAFILNKDINVSSLNFSAYDFTPAAANYPVGEPYDYTYSINSRMYTANRQQLGSYSPSASDLQKNSLRFAEAGEYALVLIAVDAAGNRSDATVYSSMTYNSVKVDNTTRSVGAHFYYDNNIYYPGSSTFKSFASVYVIPATAHDSNGNCTVDINNTQASTTTLSANNSLQNVYRDSYVTIRIVMTASTAQDSFNTQAYNYSLVRYTLGNTIAKDNPTYAVNKSGNYVYDITFKMDDAIWNYNNTDGGANARPLAVVFHRRMKLELISDDFTYSVLPGGHANVIAFSSDNFRVSFPNNPSELIGVTPRIKVNYYVKRTAYIYAHYEEVDNTNVLTTGGYIAIDGREYAVPDNESLKPYADGEKRLITDDGREFVFNVYGKHVSSTVDSSKYALLTVDCYDLNDALSGVTDAGSYYYWATIDASDTGSYYGELFSEFTVKQATPAVLNVTGVGTEADGSLVYGDSLDKLTFTSTDEYGRVITDKKVLNFDNGVRVFVKSSAGVWGEFSISAPSSDTIDYKKHPVVDNYIITVTFRPIDVSEFSLEYIERFYSVIFNEFVTLERDADKKVVGYSLIEGKSTAKNFAEQSVEVSVRIKHALAYVEVDFVSAEIDKSGNVQAGYDGSAKSVPTSTYYLDGAQNKIYLVGTPVIVEYKILGENDDAYTRTAPYLAGTYEVRMTIDSSKSNYMSTQVGRATLIILRREVTISVSESEPDNEHETLSSDEKLFTTYTYRDVLTYTYGYLKTANFESSFENQNGINETVSGLSYLYRFRKASSYDQYGNEFKDEDPGFSDYVAIIASNSLDAGIYLMEVTVDNANHTGTKYIKFVVKQARVGAAPLTIKTPSIKAPYSNISLNGTDYGRSGHIEFGETLAEATKNIINNNGYARYRYSGTSADIAIDGIFQFESEKEYLDRINKNLAAKDKITLPCDKDGNLLLDVKYDASGNIASYTIMLVWRAGKYDEEGTFVPNNNFLAYSTAEEINVVRATPNFSNVKLSDIIYGSDLSSSAFTGNITSHGYTFGEGEYGLTIAPEEQNRVLNGGVNTIKCIFEPKGEAFLTRFLTLYSVEIKLTVLKREVQIQFLTYGNISVEELEFAPTESEKEAYLAAVEANTWSEKGVKYIYGASFSDPVVSITTEGNSLSLYPQYRYYRLAELGEESDLTIDDIDYKLLPDGINTSTPIGKYYVYASILDSDSNYKGGAFAPFYVVRAALNYAGGMLPKKTIIYGDNINSVDFGSVILIYGANAFRGTFKVKYYDGSAYVDSYLPPVTKNTDKNVYLEFVPVAEDEALYLNNCREYIVSYFLEVDKQDVSDRITVTDLYQTFTDKPLFIGVSATDTLGNALDCNITYNGVDYDAINAGSNPANYKGPTAAGSYEVVIRVDEANENYCGERTITFVIGKARVDFYEIEYSVDSYAAWYFRNYCDSSEESEEDEEQGGSVKATPDVENMSIAQSAYSLRFDATEHSARPWSTLPKDMSFNFLFEAKNYFATYFATNIVLGALPSGDFEAYNDFNTFSVFDIQYSYYDGTALSGIPSQIGSYKVRITLIHDNFEGEYVATVNITENLDSITPFTGLEQVYSTTVGGEGIRDVAPNYAAIIKNGVAVAHPDLDKTIVYYPFNGEEYVVEDAFTSTPVNAGKYMVVVTFKKVQGYQAEPYILYMEIAKADAHLELAASYERVYTSEKIVFGVTLPAGISEAIYEYKKEGDANAEYSAIPPVSAGRYDVRVTIVSNNYFGVDTSVLIVNKAAIEIRALPIPAAVIAFRTKADDVFFREGSGRVIFPVTGETLSGSFRILSEDLADRRVGTHTVTIAFTADNDNFLEAYTLMDIDIVKRDISEYITFDDEYTEVSSEVDGVIVNTKRITYSYRGAGGIALSPTVDTELMESNGLTIPDGYGKLRYLVTYSGQTAAQSRVGSYAVRVSIDDDNFSGYLDNAVMIINKAEPILSLPTFTVPDKGAAISDSMIIPDSGYAYIMNGSERIMVNGSFSINASYIGSAIVANENYVIVDFTPQDSSLFDSVSKPAVIIGNGISVNLAAENVISVSGEEVYGATLDKFSIGLKDTPALGEYNAYAYGTIAWANPSEIIGVGELAEYIFTPYKEYINDYNVVRGYVAVTVRRNIMSASAGSSAYVFEGRALGEAVVDLRMVYGPDATPVEGCEIIWGSEGKSLTEPIYGYGREAEGVKLVLTVRHPNFEDAEVKLSVYVYLSITEFTVAHNAKYYDGNPVAISELGIIAAGTNYNLNDEDFVFESITLGGVKVSEICAAGVYTVTVAISEQKGDGIHHGSHKGSFTFTYTVSKRDISASIAVTGNDKIFADVDKLRVDFGEYRNLINLDAVRIRYYAEGLRDYGSLPPTDAGVYKVTVSLGDEDLSFVASATFDYIIRKRAATVTLESVYLREYNPNVPVDILPDVSNNLNSDSYVITFTKQGASVPVAEPVEAGTYIIRVDINHNNYEGYALSTLVISRANIEIIVSPTLDSLQYGLKLKGAGITGGKAITYGGADVKGIFEFVDPDNDRLPVGQNTVSLRFIPYNVNYAEAYISVIIEITKAYAALEYDSLSAVYNGTPRYPTFLTDLNLTYSFKQGGYNVSFAIDAGEYEVTVKVNDKNFEGEATVIFTVLQASLIEEASVMPYAGAVEYGRILNNSYLRGGSMVYLVGGGAVTGTFSYLNGDTLLGSVGLYHDIPFVFVPQDSVNYMSYVGYVDVEVVKASAVITVTGNYFTYGDLITAPVFHTTPANMRVVNDSRFAEFQAGNAHAGIHKFTAEIDDDNYQGSLIYAIYIDKKDISIAYYFENVIVDRYNFTYGHTSVVNPRVIPGTLVGDDKADEIQKMILCQYYPASNATAPSVTVPSAVGEYYALATLTHPDYSIDDNSARIPYIITRAEVSSVVFDPELLSTQIYGSVSVPSVVTSPANVNVRVEFPGFAHMPTAAGNYSIKAVVEDPNYMPMEFTAMFRINPKEILIEKIKVENKKYDGLPDVTVYGELGGVMVGDEVILSMTAETLDKKVAIGSYPVVITSYTLSGLHANNYKVYDPVYSLTVRIYENKISDPATGSYITSAEGLSSNVTVSFSEVYDTINKTNIFTRLFGQKATVQVISIKENGLDTALDTKVKFYAKIPDQYLNARKLKVEGAGNLKDITSFTREGDYITFYADTSGEIVFYTNDFPYWILIAVGVVVTILLAFIFIMIMAPIRKRKHIGKDARRLYGWEHERGGFEERYNRELRAQEVKRKRRWRM